MSDETWIAKIKSDGKSSEHSSRTSDRQSVLCCSDIRNFEICTTLCAERSAHYAHERNALEHVPVQLMTEDMCMEAVKSKGMFPMRIELDKCVWPRVNPTTGRTGTYLSSTEEMRGSFPHEYNVESMGRERIAELVRLRTTRDMTENNLMCG